MEGWRKRSREIKERRGDAVIGINTRNGVLVSVKVVFETLKVEGDEE